ncbi:DUF2971 domain-containing protein [Photobacterium leiognathi]|uniref:DUF2971 domain-containing protein n=1 Tax=Photobacterium leiognathi TaxID=553611 RepID=UPI003D9FD362
MYHYTDLNGFISIMQFKKLWLTSATSMNNHQEVHWFKNLFYAKLTEILEHQPLSGEQIELLNSFWSAQVNPISNPHICCFSENGDLLSQWRAYADDAAGMSIGFDSSKLNLNEELAVQNIIPDNNIWLNSVIYEHDEQQRIVDELAESFVNAVKAVTEQQDPIQAQEAQMRLSVVASQCSSYSYIFKNPAFSEEKEVRVISLPMLDNSNKWFGCKEKPKFRSSGGTIASYFELEFAAESVNEVILGPKSKVNKADMDTFLRSNGLGHVEVRLSTASYR